MAATPISRWLDERTKDADLVLRANTIGAVHDAVLAGLGVGALPCLLGVRSLTRVGAAQPASSPIWTIVHEDLARSARVRAVLAFVGDVLRRSSRPKRSLTGRRD